MRWYGGPLFSCAMVTRWPRAFRIRAQRNAVTRFPCRDWAGAGVIRAIFMRSSYHTPPGRRCKTRQSQHGGRGGRHCRRYCTTGARAWPGRALKEVAIAKPGGRILTIGIVHEIAWERIERRRSPFPDIARHLAAAKDAIASGEGNYVGTPQEACVQIGTRRRRAFIAPGIAAFAPGNLLPVRGRLST